MADQVLYEVERLLDKKLEKKHVFYLVRWKNFSEEYDTWEPAGNLRACQTMFRDFESDFDKKRKAWKSASIAAKLLKNSKLPSTKGHPPKLSSGALKKGSQLAARQKIAAQLKSKAKHLAKLEAVFQGKAKHVKKSVPTSSSLIVGASSSSLGGPGSNSSSDSAKKNVVQSAKKKSKESSDKGSKRSTQTPKSGKKDDSVKKKTKKDASESDTPKSNTNTEKNKKVSKTPVESKSKNNTEGTDASSKVDKKKNPSTKPKGDSNSDTVGNKSSVNSSKALPKSKNNASKKDTSSPSTRQTRTDSTSNCDQSVPYFSIVSDSESDDDDDVLYSLMDGVDAKAGWKERTELVAKDQCGGFVMDKSSSNGAKMSPKKTSPNSPSSSKTPGSASKRMSLMDFKKPKSSKQKPGAFEQLLRPSSPTPFFTPLKAAQSPLLGALPTTSSLAMDSLVGDVPSFQAAPAGPLSPSAISYKTLLDSLPSQLHPKGKKKKENSNGASSSSGASGQSSASYVAPEPIERRISVRAAECVFRYKQIVVKKLHRYTQIWLNTQTVMKNAFNPQVVQEVVAALNTAKYDDSSLVLFSGIGSFFCSGIDLHFLTTGDVRIAARQMADALRELTKAFITFPKPVIAAVGGSAAGLGVALLCLCDVVYASDKAAFHIPYAQLSQTPEGCASFTLPLNIGLAAASELLFAGRRITAMEAYQLGLVSHVFWPTAFMQEVIPRAQNMASCTPKVLEGTKLLIRSHHRTKMELTNETECNLLLERWASSECQRAMEAYLANENNFSS